MNPSRVMTGNGACPRGDSRALDLELGRESVEAELGLTVARCRRLTPEDVPALEMAVVTALDAVPVGVVMVANVWTSAVRS